jgi:hypothetical protein
MNSKELKVFCVNHVLNDVPMNVWEREFNARKHLTETLVRNGEFFETNTPMFVSVEAYKRDRFHYAITKTGKLNTHSVSRKSKRRDDATGNWMRTFHMCMMLLDHDIIVVTDPTDTSIVSVDYRYNHNTFLDGSYKDSAP